MTRGSEPPFERVTSLVAVGFIASVAIFVQAFVVLKLSLLVLFLVLWMVRIALGAHVPVYPRLVAFYLSMCVLGVAWAIIGLMHRGNYVEGINDSVRLYVIWSLAFVLLFSLLRAGPALRVLHVSLVAAGIVISLINFAGVADQIGGWGLISDGVRKPLELYVGLKDGYIQITSNNIGPLFVIVPYLMALQFRSDAGNTNSVWAKVSLAFSIALVILSGRRALWILVALAPCIILLLTFVTASRKQLRPRVTRVLGGYMVATVVTLASIAAMPSVFGDFGAVRHVREAFSAQDERSIQKGFLVHGFAESPVLGSGFGAYAGYLRNEERPWTYELTYHQMLFNLGIVGTGCVGALVAAYVVGVISLLRKWKSQSAIPFALLVGLGCLFIGSYSNPYLKSFDYLFFVGLLPLLATFQRGFGKNPSDARALV